MLLIHASSSDSDDTDDDHENDTDEPQNESNPTEEECCVFSFVCVCGGEFFLSTIPSHCCEVSEVENVDG